MKLFEIVDERKKFDAWVEKYVQTMLKGEPLDVKFEDGKWSVGDPINIIECSYIPWPMTRAESMIQIQSPNLKSLKNIAPYVGEGFAILWKCTALESLEHMPREIHGDLTLAFDDRCKIKSLKGIDKLLDKMSDGGIPDETGVVTLGHGIKSNVLGLLKIPGVKKIRTTQEAYMKKLEIAKVCVILNKHVGQGNNGIIKAQRELIDADLDDYAEF